LLNEELNMIFVVIYIFFVIKSLTRSLGEEVMDLGSRQGIEFIYDFGLYMCMQGNWIPYILTSPFFLMCAYISAQIQYGEER